VASVIILGTGIAYCQDATTPATPSPVQSSAPTVTQPARQLTPSPQDAANTESNANKGQIRLRIVVTDASGKLVTGLTQDDFTVLDNHIAAKVTSFREAGGANPTEPVQLILVLDMLNNDPENVVSERQQVEKFLGEYGGRLPIPVSIVLFSYSGAKINGPSRDGNFLIANMRKMPNVISAIGAGGDYGAIDRWQRSLKILNQLIAYGSTMPGRKVLVWISPGWPSLTGNQFRSNTKDKDEDWNWIISFTNHLREAGVTLYRLSAPSFGSSLYYSPVYKNFLKPVTNLKEAGSGNLALPVLATQSGGLVLDDSNDLARRMAICMDEATSYYSVSYTAPTPTLAKEYRPLEVKMAKPGEVARTNSGYYAQP